MSWEDRYEAAEALRRATEYKHRQIYGGVVYHEAPLPKHHRTPGAGTVFLGAIATMLVSSVWIWTGWIPSAMHGLKVGILSVTRLPDAWLWMLHTGFPFFLTEVLPLLLFVSAALICIVMIIVFIDDL